MQFFKSFSLVVIITSVLFAKDIYCLDYIDFNKNGKMDIYENPQAPVEDRIDDLISQMTLDEKTCQMVTLYGYGRVLKDSLPTPEWKNRIWKDGIGAIDEHLNSFRGWGKKPQKDDLTWPPSSHSEAMNKVQRWFIEETRLGIPVDFTNEGIRGVEAYKATNFPTQLGIGCTWNKSLVRKIGEITGQEARLMGYTNVYAPILDVARDQRWGRMEEVYGESPYLVGQLGVEMVKGLQKDFQVAATAKHFAIYSNNKGAREGMARTDPKNSIRESHMLFLKPFKMAIEKAGLLGVMSAYNDFDGEPVTGSRYFLTNLLREKYGFKGYVVSDSDALHYIWSKHRVAETYKEAIRQSIEAGLNVRCTFRSTEEFVHPLRELVKAGKLSESLVNDRVRDILRVKFIVGLFDQPYVKNLKKADRIVNSKANQKYALQASRESLVLLKNEDNRLPLSKDINRIALCGPNAKAEDFATTHYGPQAVEVTSVYEGLKKISNAEILYSKGCHLVDDTWPESEILPQPLTKKEKHEIAMAVDNAKRAEVAIVVLGGGTRTCGENKSRTSLNLPGRQLDLLKAVYATGTPTIVVLINGRPLSINWTDKNIPAILEAWYPGSFGGQAIAEVLFGDYNPGGKLTTTFPKTVGQVRMNFPSKPNAQVDNHWTSARVNGVIYPFGHGLSYTTFAYSDLTITPEKQSPGGKFFIKCRVKNTGNIAGEEIIQLYIRDNYSSVTTYEKNLRGFERIYLKPGDSKIVRFEINPEDLELLDRNMNWVVEPGGFDVMIGRSSEDIRLNGKFEIIK